MRLTTITPHTYDGRSLGIGDEYIVADPDLAAAIVAYGMAARVPDAPPTPPKKHPPAK